MVRTALSPAVLPAFVAQHALYLPEYVVEPRRLFPHIPLPAVLAGAVEKRQAEFLAGRHCALAAIRHCRPELAVETVESGPDRAPVWPEGLVGSITHASRFVWAAVAREEQASALGIDSEALMDGPTAQAVWSSVAGLAEVAVVRSSGFDFATALTLIFSAKEATFKCLYSVVRRYFDYREAEVTAVAPRARALRLRLSVDLGRDIRAGTVLWARFELRQRHVHVGMHRAADPRRGERGLSSAGSSRPSRSSPRRAGPAREAPLSSA